MHRRHFFSMVAALGIWSRSVARADDEPSGSATPQPGGKVADLEQTLKSGLRARRQLEFDFIHQVVLKVKAKELPADLVQSTFQWARKRGSRYPYPYFERGMRERAQRLGVDL
jgi:hypothetical protein